MRRTAVLLTLGVAAAAPAGAEAAAIGFDPAKACYLEGEEVTVRGGGFSPGGIVNVALDDASVGQAPVDPAGNIAGQLQLGNVRGMQTRTLTGTDATNPTLTASTPFNQAELGVRVTPSGGRPNRKRRVRASGFLTGSRLYAHAVRRGYRRTTRIGKLGSPCGTVTARARLFSRRSPVGQYRVQFDTSRRYRRSTPGRVLFKVRVFRTFRRSSAAAATAERWTFLGAVR